MFLLNMKSLNFLEFAWFLFFSPIHPYLIHLHKVVRPWILSIIIYKINPTTTSSNAQTIISVFTHYISPPPHIQYLTPTFVHVKLFSFPLKKKKEKKMQDAIFYPCCTPITLWRPSSRTVVDTLFVHSLLLRTDIITSRLHLKAALAFSAM